MTTHDNDIYEMAEALAAAHSLIDRIRNEFTGRVLTMMLACDGARPGFKTYLEGCSYINLEGAHTVTVTGLGGPDNLLFDFMDGMQSGQDPDELADEIDDILCTYFNQLGLGSEDSGSALIEYFLLHVPEDLELLVAQAIYHSLDFGEGGLNPDDDISVLMALATCPSSALTMAFAQHGVHGLASVFD